MKDVDLLIKGGKIVTAAGIVPGAISVSGGKIAALLSEDSPLPSAKETIDVEGRYILPGLVDPEGHLGTMRPLADDLDSESCGALATGVTTWGLQLTSPMITGARPSLSAEEVVPFSKAFPAFREAGDGHSRVDYFLTPIITTDEQALEIPQMAERYGVTSFKYYMHMKQGLGVFSKWLAQRAMGFFGFDDGTVYLGLENTARIGPPGIVCFHPENWEMVRIFEDRLMKAGRTDMAAWDARSPHFCEAGHVCTYAYYAKVTNTPIYIQHVTTRETLDEILKARAEGVKIYGQTAACYLSLPHDVWKVNVPLRDRETIEVLWEAVRDGIVDCSGTDHVNVNMSKETMDKGNVWETLSGFPSRVEAFLPVMLSEGVNKRGIPLTRIVEFCCENPAKIFGIYPKKGTIAPGSDADLVVVDLNLRRKVTNDMVFTSAGWTVYEGWDMKGWPVMTILRGKVVMEWPPEARKARIKGPPMGQYVPRKPGQQYLSI